MLYCYRDIKNNNNKTTIMMMITIRDRKLTIFRRAEAINFIES